ncbi:MAG: hypothetical protein V1649_01835 [Patescibacteria group bacterium]
MTSPEGRQKLFCLVGRLLEISIKNDMSKKTIKTKGVKKEEKALPKEIIILQDVCKTMVSTAFLMDDLIEELIHQMR